jgi:hypothetical protein
MAPMWLAHVTCSRVANTREIDLKTSIILVGILPGFLAGCAVPTPLAPTVTIYTSPSAATVGQIDGSGGNAKSPATFTYQRPSVDKCFIIKGFTARWISGAKANTAPTLQLCGASATYNVTIDRPADVAGAEYDIQQAVEQGRAAQEAAAQASASVNQAGFALGQAFGQHLAK